MSEIHNSLFSYSGDSFGAIRLCANVYLYQTLGWTQTHEHTCTDDAASFSWKHLGNKTMGKHIILEKLAFRGQNREIENENAIGL